MTTPAQKMVPREPTAAMFIAGTQALAAADGSFARYGWRAMYDAAPAAPLVAEGDERQRFEAWYAEDAFDFERDPIGSRDCSLQWRAWQAATEKTAAASPVAAASPSHVPQTKTTEATDGLDTLVWVARNELARYEKYPDAKDAAYSLFLVLQRAVEVVESLRAQLAERDREKELAEQAAADFYEKLFRAGPRIAELERERDAAVKDARRYRAIRNDAINPMRMFARKDDDERMVGVESMLTGAELDTATDAAIAQAGGAE